MEFSRQKYWSGLPFPSPEKSAGPRDWTHISCLAGRFFTTEPPGKPHKSPLYGWGNFTQLFGWPRSLAFLEHSCCLFGLAKGQHVQCWGGAPLGRGHGSCSPTPSVYRARLRPWTGEGPAWDIQLLNKDKSPKYHFLWWGLGDRRQGRDLALCSLEALTFIGCAEPKRARGECSDVQQWILFVLFFEKVTLISAFMLPKSHCLECFFFLLSFLQYILFPYLLKNIYLSMIF